MLLYTEENNSKRPACSFTNIKINLIIDINGSVSNQKHNIRLGDIIMALLSTELKACFNIITEK